MIAVDTLLYEIDQRLNKLSSFDHQNIALEDKIIALRNGQIQLIKKKVSQNNVYKIGLDGFKKRYQDLQFLIENAENHKLSLTETDPILHKYVANISTITPKFMFYIDSYVIADKGECKDRVLTCNPDLVKHADVQLLLNNENFKPSFEYQETIIDIASDELQIYTDGTFTPKYLYVTYLRYPLEIDKAGYINFDGTPSIDQDSEFEDYLKDELLDLAVGNLAQYTENQSAAAYAKVREDSSE